VIAKRGAPTKVAACVSSYVSTEGLGLAAACAFDIELANHAGAALAMVPTAVATDAIRARMVEGDMLENLREVANIMASLFTCPTSHIKLKVLARTPPAPAPDIVALTARPVRRLDLEVDITGYGAGRLAIFFAAPPVAQ
jgi:hypothetical protein